MTIGDILPTAIGVAISPIPIVTVILMLFSARPKSNALAFLVGWMGGLVIAGGIILTLADVSEIAEGGDPTTVSYVIKLLLGLLLLFLAYRDWQGQSKPGEETEMPAWMAGIETFTPVKALGLAVLFSGPNPKNLALTAAAAMTIAQSGLSGASAWLALLVFVLLASITVVGPVLYYLLAGEKAEKTLNTWKSWLSDNNATVMAVLLLVFGVMLIGDGLGGLFT